MINAVSSLTIKRYMKKWHCLLSRRTGLQLLDYIYIKTRQRELFKRVKRKAVFDDNLVRHMKLFHLFKLMEFTFNGLKRNVTLKHLWTDNSIKMKIIKKQLHKR
jgi:hypothetical protein